MICKYNRRLYYIFSIDRQPSEYTKKGKIFKEELDGTRQILVGLLGAAGCMAYEWMMGGVCAEQLTAGFSVLGVLYMVYLIGGIGAGDVKLLAVTGFIWGRPVWRDFKWKA